MSVCGAGVVPVVFVTALSVLSRPGVAALCVVQNYMCYAAVAFYALRARPCAYMRELVSGEDHRE